MLEQLSLLLATPIAKAILNKFYEGLGSELAKKAVDKLPTAVKTKVQQLGQLVWEKCLRGKPGTEELLQVAADKSADGSEAAQAQLAEYLSRVLASDAALNQQVQKLADEIHQNIQFDDVTTRNSQQIFGGTGQQFNNENINAPTQQGSITNHNYYGTKPY